MGKQGRFSVASTKWEYDDISDEVKLMNIEVKAALISAYDVEKWIISWRASIQVIPPACILQNSADARTLN